MEQNIQKNMHDMRGVITLVLIMVVVALGAYTYLTVKEARHLPQQTASINVSGEGEVFAKPDIATFSFSVTTEGADAATAQEESAEAINDILTYLEEEGVAERDIKTEHYNLNPRYDYVRSVCNTDGFCPPGERVLRGYEATQTVQVKVRDIDEAGTLISGAGTRGATNVSSLRFTIDDDDVYREEARAAAIQEAKEKAEKLADDLGVRLVRIMHFNENQGGYPMPYYAMDGRGGADMAVEEAESAPNLPTGENTFRSNVNITYEIR